METWMTGTDVLHSAKSKQPGHVFPIFPQHVAHYLPLIYITGIPLFNETRVTLDNQIIQSTYNYNESIQGKTGTLQFELNLPQPHAPTCIINANQSLSLKAQASNNLPLMLYT